MQKKLLTSLLVAPISIGALANIQIVPDLANSGEGWSQTGISGATNVFNGSGVTVPLGSGIISRSLGTLKPGTYIITFVNPDNLKVSITTGNTPVASTIGDDGSVKFTVVTEGVYTLTINGKDQSKAYSFGSATLEIDFDLSAIQAGFNESLNGMQPLTEVPADDTSSAAAELRSKKEALDQEIAGLKDKVAALAETIDCYNDNGFWKGEGKDDISVAIAVLQTKVDAYNDKVSTETDTYTTITSNQNALNELNQGVKDYKTQLANLNELVGDDETYVINTTADEKAAAEKDLKAWEDEIADKYADLEQKDITVDETIKTALEEALTAYRNAITEAKADWDAYSAVIALQTQLGVKTNEALTAIGAYKGLAPIPDDYSKYLKDQTDLINKTYADALSACTIRGKEDPTVADGLKGFVASKEADTETINDAIATLNQLVTDNNTINEKYVADDNMVLTYQKNLDEVIADTNKFAEALPADEKATFEGLKTDAQNAITDLVKLLNGDYDADYTTQKQAVDDAMDALNEYIAAWTPVIELYDLLDAFKQHLNELQENSGVPTTTFNLSDKFAGTITALEGSIKDIYTGKEPSEFDSADIENVKQTIADETTYSDQLMKAYVDAYNAVKDYNTKIAAFEKIVNAKYIAPAGSDSWHLGSTWTNANYRANDSRYKALIDKQTELKQSLAEVAALDAQACFDAANALTKAITEWHCDAKVRKALLDYEVAATGANYNVADNAITLLNDYAQDGEYEGKGVKDMPDIAGFQTTLAAIKADLNALGQNTYPDVEKWDAIDQRIDDLLKQLDEAYAKVKALKDNQAAYDDLKDAFDKAFGGGAFVGPDVPALDGLNAHNQATSVDPALTYYDNLINGSDSKSLKSLLDALKSDIDKALNDFNAVNQKETLQNRINGLEQEIQNTKDAITANQSAYETQLAKSASVLASLNEIKAEIEAMGDTDTQNLQQIKDWGTAVESLINNDLTAEDLAVLASYGKGASSADNKKHMDEYDRILNAAKEIQSQCKASIGDLVSEANQVWLHQWTDQVKLMNAEYKAAIDQYNAYYRLTNPNYRAYILSVVETHKDIYQFSKLITDKDGSVQGAINAQTENQNVLSQAEYEVYVEQATDLINEIKEKVAEMTDDANKAAEAYYNDEQGLSAETDDLSKGVSKPEADQAIADAARAMMAAGISGSITDSETNLGKALAKASGLYTAAVDSYDNAFEDGKPKADFSLSIMDNIANNLDKVPGAIDLQAAALNQWTDSYDTAKATFEDLTNRLNAVTQPDNESRATLQGYADAAAELNTQATGNHTNLIDELHGYLTQLEEILSNATDLVQDAETKFALDEANKNAFDAYTLQAQQLEDELAKLKKFVASLAGRIDFTPIQTAIDDAKKAVENNKETLASDQTKELVDKLFTTAENAIENGYPSEQSSENVAIQTLYDQTRVAFNNAKAALLADESKCTLTLDELNDIEEQINSYIVIANVINGLPLTTDVDKSMYQARAIAVETGLSDIYVKLQSSYNDSDLKPDGNPVDGIVADLQSVYDSVNEAIAAAQGELDKDYTYDEKTGYQEQLDDLKTQLDAVKAAWEADGNKVVMTADNRKADMEAIQAAVTELEQQIKAANDAAQADLDKAAANKTAFDALTADLNAIQTELEAIEALSEEYGLKEAYQRYFDNVQEAIDEETATLQDLYDQKELADEINHPDFNYLTSYLAMLRKHVETTNYTTLQRNAYQAVTDAQEALNQKVVPEIKAEEQTKLDEINSSVDEQAQRYAQALSLYNTSDMTDEDLQIFYNTLHDIDAKLKELAAQAAEINATAAANVFIPGDVNENPDGEVNTFDLQLLLSWIGDRMTYTELYEQSPVQAAAADLDGNQRLNVADATMLINIILNEANNVDPNSVARRVAPAGHFSTDNNIALKRVSSENGVRDYVVELTNSMNFIAGQFDVKLPAGMTLTDVTLDSRAAGHEAMLFDNGGGNYRVIVFSMSNATFSGNSGSLVHLTIEGIGTPEIQNAIFADEYFNGIEIKAAESSMIEMIQEGAVNVKEHIYDAAGRMMNGVKRGINIIRKSDGTTTKELH